ncbi:eukaryotic translation initiation factor 3 subunit A [Clydaea vesicula]|uniref:Eukaryotic translation initiation factor 3 subunit A n=1 Tax=Clydaea vesicula TaxID=447962 RepID=A0AAD5U219_9FUNG|nr:eukaryotic translation initiation factor 3 subunit A [Clydaea vesicula]
MPTVASQAFDFCLNHVRNTEFRRLCELLRQHLQTTAKYSHQPHSVNLNEPETLHRHLDTRFRQLNVASALELWQEAYRSIEDIHQLLDMTKKTAKPFMMSNYYEKLAKIFLVGENYLFHAAAWNKLYQNKRNTMSDHETQKMASMVLISALSIPIISAAKTKTYSVSEDNKLKNLRLSALLLVATPPSREALLKFALNKSVFQHVLPELKDLYSILEVQFHPLSICKKIEPIMQSVLKNNELAKYAKPLQSVILTRLLQQLSQVYTTVKIDSIVNLATFQEPFNLNAHKIEKFIMNGCKRGELSIRIDHQTQSITFEQDVFSNLKTTVSEGPRLGSLPVDQMRFHLSRLAYKLQIAAVFINPQLAIEKAKKRKEAVDLALQFAEKERLATVARRTLIEKKKEDRENDAFIREQREREERARAQVILMESERRRIENETKLRAEQKLQADLASAKKEADQKSVNQLLKALSDKGIPVKDDLLAKEPNELAIILRKMLDHDLRHGKEKARELARRTDHLARAFKKEEIPLLKKDYEHQKNIDRANHIALNNKKLEESKILFKENMETKKRLERMLADANSFKDNLKKNYDSNFNEKKSKLDLELKNAKDLKRKQVLEEREAERVRLEKELEEKKRLEEQKLQEQKEKARLAQEKLNKEESERAASLERRKKFDEQARKQNERTRAAEEKLNSLKKSGTEVYGSTGKVVPGASAKANVDDTGSKKYVPPQRQSMSSQSPVGSDRADRTRGSRVGASERYGFSDRSSFRGNYGSDTRENRYNTGSDNRERRAGDSDRDNRYGNSSRDNRDRRVGDSDRDYRSTGSSAFERINRDRKDDADGGWRKVEEKSSTSRSTASKPSGDRYIPPSQR